jgi:hypothetical protein
MSLILIGAHPKTIDYDKGELLTKHFWGNSIQSFIEKENIPKPIKIETIDLLPGGTYQNDIFDDIFVKEHYETYDQIYLLDCGGIWYVLQTLDIPDNFAKYYNSNEIIEMRKIMRHLTHEEISNVIELLIKKIYSMLKPNGICLFSKFTNSNFQEGFIEQINQLSMNYTVEKHLYIGTVIIIRKI